MFKRNHHPAAAPDYAVCCDPASLMFGAAATATAPATGGLIGVGGAFSLGQTAMTVGSIAGAIGAFSQGQAASQQAGLQAELYGRNATLERQRAEAEAAQFARDERRMQGRLRALQGGSGARTGTGTPLTVEEDRATEAEFQRLNILHGGATRASALNTQAVLTRAGGRAARRRGYFTGGARLLQGFGETFGS